MRLFLLCFALFSLSNVTLQCQTTPEQILKTTLESAKRLSLYSGEVNWDSLETELMKSASEAKSTEDLNPCFESLFNSLGDHHATMRSATDYSIQAHYTGERARNIDEREFPSETWAIVNDLESRFEYAVLENNVGYLKVVGIGGNVDGQAEAERIRAAIEELTIQKVEKWILDLRFNGGGNINIMMAGLAPLFDEGVVASIRDAAGETQGTAEIRDGQFYYMQQNAFEVKRQVGLNKPKIAVLLSRWTVSSGELLAVALKGQENVQFFGERTGGYTTNNCWESIEGELFLSMSTGIYCDRNRVIYEHYVEPNVEVDFEPTAEFDEDSGVIIAKGWLKQSMGK